MCAPDPPTHSTTSIQQVRDTVAIHVPCSSKKMGIEDSTLKLAQLCAHEVRRYICVWLGSMVSLTFAASQQEV